ncbi:MAG: hypothetical protein P1V97_38065 [Planctomycetota bacterium]|nr:hypothetical protein [Planctomycetota bacterium]
MKSLTALLNDPKDREYLEERGVFVDLQAFEAELRPCSPCPMLPEEQSQGHVIWAGQQLYCDYRHSVTSKMRLLHELKQRPGLKPFFLCADTDRSGSEKAITTINWPLPQTVGTLQVVKVRASRHIESRFVTSELATRETAIHKLREYLKQSVANLETVLPRYERLKELFLKEGRVSLADINLSITRLLMSEMGYEIPSYLLSDFINRGAVHHIVNTWLNRRDACIEAFNDGVLELEELNIDSAVRKLPEDYLPLNYSCPIDQFRLRYERQGEEHFAVGTSRKGNVYRFSLGHGPLDFKEIADTKRWSPDVCVPIFFNDFVSGVVVGKSSALYGLVLNRVLERGLGQRPVPMLVPDFDAEEKKPEPDSALYHFLVS